MDDLSEWANLAARWFHIVAGIAWIGQTYLFNFMERVMEPPADGSANVAGRLWMVHGGGFYRVEKQRVPEIMPQTLHWFKWESALTWLSGFALLWIVYYLGGAQVEPESGLSETQGILIGLGALVGGWLAYNLLLLSPLGGREWALGAAALGAVTAAAWGLARVISPRAAYLHVGAMFGTIMAANVWLRILPAQNDMLAAVKAGRPPDMALAARAKRCSKHNTFMSVPLVLLMISNHFPNATYGHARAPLILGLLVALGWAAAKILRDHL